MSEAEHEPLFPGYDPPPVEPGEELSAGQRLTRRQQQDVTNGVHPLTRGPLHPDATTLRHAPIPGHPDCHPDAPCSGSRDEFTCGTCVHRDASWRRYPKCVAPVGPGGKPMPERLTHSAATDVRAWWPACPAYDSGFNPDHVLDAKARPPACSCGARWAGGAKFVRDRHAEHVREAATDD